MQWSAAVPSGTPPLHVLGMFLGVEYLGFKIIAASGHVKREPGVRPRIAPWDPTTPVPDRPGMPVPTVR